MQVKPDNPGGMQIPDRDMLIYGQQRPQVEHLLPPPEEPMARPAPPPPPSPAPQQPVQTAAAPSPPAEPAVSAVVPPAAAVSPAVPPVPPATPRLASTEAEVSPSVAPSPLKSTARQQLALSPAAAAAAEELGIAPELEPTAAARTRSTNDGGVRLQLGSVRSESEARGAWARLKHQNGDLLGNLSGTAIRADLGDKGIYYQIEAGPVADPSAADRICGMLRQRHLACVMVR